jgi:threonyl-tRNA synthetase
MVHRSVIGGLERLVAHLIEIHEGAFPPWYAPTQLAILPVSDAQEDAALTVAEAATAAGLRVEMVAPDESLAARIRAKRLVPYLAIVGAREVEAKAMSVRVRDGRQLPMVPTEEALAKILARVRSRSHELWPVS